MDTIGPLLAEVHGFEGIAFESPNRKNGYSCREFATSAWKAGNLLRHYGVHNNGTVAVVSGRKSPDTETATARIGDTPEPIFAALGGLLLGAKIDINPPPDVDATAFVAPTNCQINFETKPGCTRLAYGEAPESAEIVHFERERWSENAVAPPNTVSPETAAFEQTTQADLLDRAYRVAKNADFDMGDRVGLEANLTPASFAAGILAPLSVGATIIGEQGATDYIIDPNGTVQLSE